MPVQREPEFDQRDGDRGRMPTTTVSASSTRAMAAMFAACGR